MHWTVSGCGDVLSPTRKRGSWRRSATSSTRLDPGTTYRRSRYTARSRRDEDTTDVIPVEASKGNDVMTFIRGIIDDGTFFEIKAFCSDAR